MKKSALELLVGVFVLLGLAAVAYLTIKLGSGSLVGGDTYLFGRGDGQDMVIDGDFTVGNTDILRFKEGVAPADVPERPQFVDQEVDRRGDDDREQLRPVLARLQPGVLVEPRLGQVDR